MELRSGALLWGVVPFLAMVSLEGCTIGLTILAKTAITYGTNTFVFVVYTNAVASFLLLPYSFLFHLNDRTDYQQSLFSLPLLLRIFLLGFIGICVSQNLAFLGLSYSSPIVVCVMGLMLPAISFILSILLRRTKINWKSPSFITKVVGTVISVIGATSEELYLGPVVRQHPSSSLHLQFKQKLLVFTSTTDRWIMGGLLLAAATLCVSIWNIIQLGVVKQYSQVMKVASFYSLVGSLMSAAMAFFIVDDLNAWIIKSKFDIFLIIATGVFSGLIRNRVQIWCMQMKGPYYVPMFKPFGILFATFFGSTFFGDTFHYGSVMAAFIAGMGYLTVMWGQMNEDQGRDDESNDDLSSSRVPLLDEESKV
ncbi:WAT1-related protein At1g70260-like [Cucurbita moschata]|uniref:WAT1-related protein n=1 Tax=Cucurbita moschata TaxID=3662 RepID=A0A6J1FLY1_CUCMO|nr:WAT1-related protein At1g70260-like [Cucurbita moschata]